MSEFHKQSENMKALEQSLNDHMEICSLRRQVKRLNAKNSRLKAEVERARASLYFVTAVPVEHYERVVKAGDAMEVSLQANFNGAPYEPLVVIEVIRRWRNAKQGKPSA
jgi:hypothetical protein